MSANRVPLLCENVCENWKFFNWDWPQSKMKCLVMAFYRKYNETISFIFFPLEKIIFKHLVGNPLQNRFMAWSLVHSETGGNSAVDFHVAILLRFSLQQEGLCDFLSGGIDVTSKLLGPLQKWKIFLHIPSTCWRSCFIEGSMIFVSVLENHKELNLYFVKMETSNMFF